MTEQLKTPDTLDSKAQDFLARKRIAVVARREGHEDHESSWPPCPSWLRYLVSA